MYKIKRFIKDKVIGNFLKLLKQGVSPHKLALSISIGFILGVFPILGTHTSLALLVIYLFRINPASVFLISNLVFPLFFIFVIPFIHIGERIFNAESTFITLESVYKMMDNGFLSTLQTLGITLFYAVVGWTVFALPASFLLYYLSIRPLKSLSKLLSNDKEVLG